MGATRKRCPVCDREIAAIASPVYPLPGCARGLVAWGAADCEAHAVDWRARALADEALIQQALEALRKPENEYWEACDFQEARSRALALLESADSRRS